MTAKAISRVVGTARLWRGYDRHYNEKAMEIEPPPEMMEFLQPYSKDIQALYIATREMVARHAPDATETLWDAISTVATGPTYTHSHMQGFIHIGAYKNHVNLGFNWGIHLDDPEGRLIGSGKQIRHVSIRTTADLEDPYILGLVRQAEEKAFRPNPPIEPTTIVRIMNGPKRRP